MTTKISHQELVQTLMKALYKDDFSTVEELLNQGVNINLPYNHYGWTPFMWVCKEHCDPEIIEKFLQYNPKLNLKNKQGQTVLHIMVCHRSSFTCPYILIEKGADVNAQDNVGNTPLMAMLSHPQISMRMVIAWNLLSLTDLTIKNNKGETAYDIAKANPAFDDKRFLEMLKESANA